MTMVMTRSAMPAITALWVIAAVVVPITPINVGNRVEYQDSRLHIAPVGSSHNSTSGRFAIASEIATRCCSPDIWDG